MTRTHRITTVDGLGLHVVEDGPSTGDPVLLMHGWPDTSNVWRNQMPALVDAGYRVLAVDQRGFGRSDRPAEVGGSHVFNAMADIGSILDSLDISRAHLVGHDWGAPPCWLAAMFMPERVSSLIAMSVGHPLAFRNAGLEQRQRSFYMLLFQFVDVAEQWLRADEWANLRMLIHDPTDFDERVAELEKPGALTASLNWYRANITPQSLVDEPADLPLVTRPTLGIMGAEDWALLPKQMVESEQYVEAEWQYAEVSNAAHWMQTEQPEAVNTLLRSWLEGHPS